MKAFPTLEAAKKSNKKVNDATLCLFDLIQKACDDALDVYQAHGDFLLATELVSNVHKLLGVKHANQVKMWFLLYCPLDDAPGYGRYCMVKSKTERTAKENEPYKKFVSKKDRANWNELIKAIRY